VLPKAVYSVSRGLGKKLKMLELQKNAWGQVLCKGNLGFRMSRCRRRVCRETARARTLSVRPKSGFVAWIGRQGARPQGGVPPSWTVGGKPGRRHSLREPRRRRWRCDGAASNGHRRAGTRSSRGIRRKRARSRVRFTSRKVVVVCTPRPPRASEA